MNFTKDQGVGVAERLMYGAFLWVAMQLVAKGFIDAEMASYLAAGAVGAVGSVRAWWVNRPKALVEAASNVIGENGMRTVVITAPEIANNMPQNNIIPNDEMKAVQK